MKNCVGITIIKLTKWQGKKSIVNVELIIVEEDCFKPTKSIKKPKELWQELKLPCIILSLILQNSQHEILQCCYHEKFLGYKQLTKLIRNKHSSLLQRIVWSWYMPQRTEAVSNTISNIITRIHTGLISLLQGFQKCIARNPSN